MHESRVKKREKIHPHLPPPNAHQTPSQINDALKNIDPKKKRRKEKELRKRSFFPSSSEQP
jgi:hypothetical protein